MVDILRVDNKGGQYNANTMAANTTRAVLMLINIAQYKRLHLNIKICDLSRSDILNGSLSQCIFTLINGNLHKQSKISI